MEYSIHNVDYLDYILDIPDYSIDLVIADPPYNLGKDYGNNSDKNSAKEFLEWTYCWIDQTIPKIKSTGSFYIFTSWQYSPEIFSYLKSQMTMINEIIWDRKVPSMGGSTKKFSSVHDNIGFFVKTKDYYFHIDDVRIEYDRLTKKQRTRDQFIGKKWLELGYNPKDVWSIARLHKLDKERKDHPTQKPVNLLERIIRASCPEKGIILDPFAGSGSTYEAAIKNNRNCIGCEINPDYCTIIETRIQIILQQPKLFFN